MDRRAAFFLVAAVICFVLTPLADPGHRSVAIVTGIVYVVLAGLSALDRLSRQPSDRQPSDRQPSDRQPSDRQPSDRQPSDRREPSGDDPD